MLASLVYMWLVWKVSCTSLVPTHWATMIMENVNQSLSVGLIKRINNKQKLECVHSCLLNPNCKGVNTKIQGPGCELLDTTPAQSGQDITRRDGWVYMRFVCVEDREKIQSKCQHEKCLIGSECWLECGSTGPHCQPAKESGTSGKKSDE